MRRLVLPGCPCEGLGGQEVLKQGVGCSQGTCERGWMHTGCSDKEGGLPLSPPPQSGDMRYRGYDKDALGLAAGLGGIMDNKGGIGDEEEIRNTRRKW